MECGIEHAHLLDSGEDFLHGLDAGYVGRVVKWREVIAVLHLLDYLIGKEHALAELLCTVNHTVTNGINLVIGFDAPEFGVSENVEHGLYGSLVVCKAEFLYGF